MTINGGGKSPLLQLHPKNFKSLLGGKTEILRYAQDDQNTVGSKGLKDPFD
jgi:hypothetical protein